jgi:hypothetical protein
MTSTNQWSHKCIFINIIVTDTKKEWGNDNLMSGVGREIVNILYPDGQAAVKRRPSIGLKDY